MRRGRSERIFRSRLLRRGTPPGRFSDVGLGAGGHAFLCVRGFGGGRSAILWVCLGAATAVVAGESPISDAAGLLPGGAVVETTPGLRESGRARAMAEYWAGLRCERGGDEAGARARYAEALSLDPGHWRLAARLAEWEVEAGRTDEALAVLGVAVRAAPAVPEPWLVMSEFCWRHQGDRTEWRERAVAAAEEAVDRFPGAAEAHGQLIQLHLRMEAPDAAAAAFERALARQDPDARFWLGLARSVPADWPVKQDAPRDRGLALLRRAYSLAPDDPVVTTALADYLALHDGMEEAASLYRANVKRRPDDLKGREKLARTLALTDHPAEAVEQWQAVLRVDPQHEAAHRALAKHFGQAGDLAASVRHRALALRWGREETVGEALRLSRDMLRAGIPVDALPVLERAEFNAPALPEPAYLAALAHHAAGDLPRALAAFARAESVALGDERTAAAFLNEGFFFEWAMAASEAGQGAMAEAKFREAISRVPAEHPELAAKSYNGLAYLWLESNQRLDEAGPLIQRALKLDPGNPACLDTLGWYHFKKGEFEQAAEVLLQAESASPLPVAEISDHRAQALWAIGRRAEAMAMLEKAAAWPDAAPALKQRLTEWRASAP